MDRIKSRISLWVKETQRREERRGGRGTNVHIARAMSRAYLMRVRMLLVLPKTWVLREPPSTLSMTTQNPYGLSNCPRYVTLFGWRNSLRRGVRISSGERERVQEREGVQEREVKREFKREREDELENVELCLEALELLRRAVSVRLDHDGDSIPEARKNLCLHSLVSKGSEVLDILKVNRS